MPARARPTCELQDRAGRDDTNGGKLTCASTAGAIAGRHTRRQNVVINREFSDATRRKYLVGSSAEFLSDMNPSANAISFMLCRSRATVHAGAGRASGYSVPRMPTLTGTIMKLSELKGDALLV